MRSWQWGEWGNGFPSPRPGDMTESRQTHCTAALQSGEPGGSMLGVFQTPSRVPSCHLCFEALLGFGCPWHPVHIGMRKFSGHGRSWVLAWKRWQWKPGELLQPSRRQM